MTVGEIELMKARTSEKALATHPKDLMSLQPDALREGFKQVTALVTGGFGFVGFNLCLDLQARGYNIVTVDNRLTESPLKVSWSKDWQHYHRSILNSTLEDCIKDVDVVFHLAVVSLPETFERPDYSLEVATHGTFRVLEAVHKAGAFFVYVSSSEVYGDGSVPMAETQNFRPTTLYGAGKAAGELITESYAKMNHLRDRYLIIRPTNCYGPHAREDKHATIITKLLRSMIFNQEMTVYGDGKQTRDFMHVSDTVDGIITAYENREKLALHPTVNLCTGKETSLNKLIELCWDAVKAEDREPMGQIVYAEQPRKGDVRRMWLDPWYTHRVLGWKSKIALKEGLRDYVKWLVEKHE